MAAAYAALVSLLNTLVDMQNHPRHSFSFDNNKIQSLLKSVSFLIEFMESFDHCSSSPNKDAAQLLEMRITCAAQAAEEVIESHIVDQILGGSTLDGKTRSPRFLLDVEKVNQDMDYVMRKAIKIQHEQRDGVNPKLPTSSTPASSSTKHLTSKMTTMVGFDDLLHQLLDQLTRLHLTSREVIPIVGTGGVGKTTLAKNAFDHKLIVQHFDVRLWATISQSYDVRDILLTLLSLQGSRSVDELKVKLHKELYGRRYLIVLDDVWSVTAWDELQFFFKDMNNGSRIIVTTRQSDVADYIGSSRLAVSLLDDDKSWDLFCQKILIGEGCPSELEDVGKKIVRKCKGLPLAIVVVAGHLGKSSRTREYWENVANNMMSILNSAENQLFDILSFSYSHLPVHLKPCFVYMGTFREDEQIDVPDLINRWIAEGFFKPCKDSNLEEIARDYLKDLIDRNLIISDCTINSYEGYTHCKIHDLLRELCLEVAKKEMFFYMVDHGQAICRVRRVGKIREENHQTAAEISHALPLVRSITCDIVEESLDLRLCRILKGDEEVSDEEVEAGFVEANLQYVNLRYLKYGTCHLDLSVVYSFLPSSISLFWNLQTLIIREEFHKLFIAPSEIWEMIQLRHLEVNQLIYLPDPPPSDQGKRLVMRNIHALMVVPELKFSEEFCKRVPNIKVLEVSYFSDEARLYCCPHNISCLSNLESLKLCILDRHGDEEGNGDGDGDDDGDGDGDGNGNEDGDEDGDEDKDGDEDVDDDDEDGDSRGCKFAWNFAFPNSLKKLYLEGFKLDWDEMIMMVGTLPHLEILYFEGKSGLVIESKSTLVEGIFPCLKSLTLRALDKWNVDCSRFPVLKNLVLKCSRLDEFPSDIGTMLTLRSITLYWCSVSLAISAMRMLVEQENEGNEDLTLDVKFYDYQALNSFKKQVEEESLEVPNLRLEVPTIKEPQD